MNELALFAGAGGGILGGKLLGWRTVCAVEREAYPAQVLAQRQNDGSLPPFPIWSDVTTFDGRPWRGVVDVVSGGFPCQDISSAGTGKGIDGSRSGLWSEMRRIISEVRPRYAYMENSPLLVSRGLALVLSDLAEMGYDAVWGIMGAADVGAPHQRDRIWVLAFTKSIGLIEGRLPSGEKQEIPKPSICMADLANSEKLQCYGCESNSKDGKSPSQESRGCGCQNYMANSCGINAQRIKPEEPNQEKRKEQSQRQARPCSNAIGRWSVEPAVGRVVNGMAYRSDRLKAIGNGQVPRVAAESFLRLMSYIDKYAD